MLVWYMSFATHRMRAPEPTVHTKENGNAGLVSKFNFFSNSGLIDYNSGFNVAVNSPAPPSGPTVNEITSVKFEPIPEAAPIESNLECSAEDSARAIARQITNSFVQDHDSDLMQMQAEFNKLSTKKKIVSFEKWVASDINRKMLMQSGAESALETQYSKLRTNLQTKRGKQVVGSKEMATTMKTSTWSSDKTDSLDNRLQAVETQVENMTVGMDDHTSHIRKIKAGIENHTDSLKKVVSGMHNHTEVLKTLSKPSTGLDSSALMRKYAGNSAKMNTANRMSNERMIAKVTDTP